MRVCFICNQIAAWGKIGGFGTNTRRLGRALVAAGIDVHVVVPRRRGQGRVERLNGMTVHGQTTREVFFDRRIYRQIDADIYHAEEPTIAAYQARQALPNRVHLVTSMDPRLPEDWAVEWWHATWMRRCKYPLQRCYEDGRLVHRAVRQADGVYVEADCLRSKTRRLYHLDRDPEVLPKPVDIPSQLPRKSKRPMCVFLGRFDPRKRPERFFALARTMPDVQFVAVGRAHDRSYQNYLQKHYFQQPNLEVIDFVDPFQSGALTRILGPAWVLVHPAAREGLPTAWQEASAHEMAVLAYVDPGRYVSRFGRVVTQQKGIDPLRTALADMLESNQWRIQGKAGRQWNIEHHAPDVSVAVHLEVYAQHLSGKAGRRRAA